MMKKTMLWYIIILAAGVFFVASTALAVMYGKDIYRVAEGQMAKLKSIKEKTLPPFLTRTDSFDF
jgi:hypothetical protein